MWSPQPDLTKQEKDVIRACFNRGLGQSTIARLMKRRIHKVTMFLRSENLRRSQSDSLKTKFNAVQSKEIYEEEIKKRSLR